MNARPDVVTRSASAWWAPVLVAGAAGGSLVLLHVRDPHDDGAYGFCPFLELTGRPCPGCGGLRALNDLTRGDIAGALSSNLLAVALVVGLAVLWTRWVWLRARGSRAALLTLTSRGAVGLAAVVVVFAVVRNTPWGRWLAP